MRRSNQNDDNRFYAFLPPNGAPSSRNSMMPSPNRNAHYQFYDTRLRSQHQLQQNLYEYQYSPSNPQRSLPTLYSSPRHQYHYPSSSALIQELSTISTNSVADLGEPISVFDEIHPLEYRRSAAIVPAPLPSTYVPPDPARRTSATEVRLATAHVLREQLLTDIERTFDDIDRELTSLERRPSMPRYLPPRFSPIAELDTQQVKPARQGTTTIQRPSVSSRRTVPTLPSPPVRQSVPQSSTNSATAERNSGTSQIWPNKPKRVYEVIPRLTSDSKRTSRQSSFTAQPEQIKIRELSTPQSPIKSSIKPITSATIQFDGQYHYPPEAEEVEILKNDPENTEFKAQIHEFARAPAHETLDPSEFLRELSARADNRAVVFVPEYSGTSQRSLHDGPEELVHAESVPPMLPRPYSGKSEDIDAPTKDSNVDENEFVVPSAAAKWKEPELNSRRSSVRSDRLVSARESPQIPSTHPARIGSEFKPRIPSRSTMTPTGLYHKTEDFFTEPENTIIAKSTKHIRPSSRTSDVSLGLQMQQPPSARHSASSTIKSTPIELISSSPVPRPQSGDDGGATGEENENGMVAYFFSEYHNEPDEDLISIDHSNFKVPIGNYVPTDDERSTNMMSPSQGSILILQSAKIGRAAELSPTVPLTNDENDQPEEKEFQREESDLTQKPRVPLPTSSPALLPNRSLSPSSSPSHFLPLPASPGAAGTRQILPISTDDDVDDNDENTRKPFDKNNSLSNDDEQQPTHMWKDDENIFHAEEEQHENHRISRSATSASRTHSQVQSAASERKHFTPPQSLPHSPIHHTNVDDEHDDQISPREESPRPQSKPVSRQLSRTTATLSPEKQMDEDTISRESPKTLTRDPSPKRTPYPPLSPPPLPQPVVLASTQSRMQRMRPRVLGEIPVPTSPGTSSITAQSFNIYLGSPTSLTREAAADRAVIKENEPHSFSAESEHFLRGKPETSYDMDKRLPSGYSGSHSNQSSRRTSTLSSPLPVRLESPDGTNEPPKTSRTVTPQKKTSIATIDVPADAHALFTTTDETDPENPSVVHSTLHFQLYPSQMQTYSPTPIESKKREESSPLPEVVPSPEQLVIPTPMDDDQLVPNENQLRTPTPSKSTPRLPTASSHRSASPEKSEHPLPLSTPTPTLSYPARLEDLMRPTPSPLRPSHDHLSDNDESNDHNRSSSPHPDPSHSPPAVPPVQHTYSSKFTPPTQVQSPPPPSPQPQTHQSRIDSPRVKRTHISGPKEPTFITEPQRVGSSERSVSSTRSENKGERFKRDRDQISSASLRKPTSHAPHLEVSSKARASPSRNQRDSMSNDEEFAYMTPSQQQSKLSLRVRRKEPKRQTTSFENLEMQNDTEDVYSTQDEEQNVRRPTKSRHRKRRVSFSNTISHFQMEERNLLANWRERVATILASKHNPKEKYAHIPARVNSFANFEYQPRRIKTMPPRPRAKTNDIEENQFQKRKKFRVKKPRLRTETLTDENTDEDGQETIPSAKETAPQLFGRLWCLPDGSPAVFHESLEWNAESRIKNYSYENFKHAPRRRDFKIFNKKTEWHSESKLADLLKESPSTVNQRQNFSQSTPRILLGHASSLPSMPDSTDPYAHRPITRQRTAKARKIFDIQTSNQQRQTGLDFQQTFMDNNSYHSYSSKRSDAPISDEKLSWNGKSQVKDTTWQNIDHKPKKSDVQIFHKSVHWNSEPKIRTRSPSTIHPSRSSNHHVQIFDEKLNWDAQAKVHCWSEIDLRQITTRKAILAQYHDPKWSDVTSARVDATNYQYPRLNNQVEIFSDRLVWNQDSKLKDYVWENFDYKSQSQTRKSKNRKAAQGTTITDQESENLVFDPRLSSMFLPQFRRVNTPPNRPRWNAVGKKNSLNSVYNPKVTNSNTIRRGWDRELRRKRVHKLPPLKRKIDPEDLPQLELEGPSSQLTSSNQLALEYHYDHSSTTQGRTTSNGYMTTSSRRSSKALVPLNHHRGISELALPTETPRSQRPVQQEWYEEMNKSRLTQRTDGERAATTRSFRHSIDSLHHSHTPKDLVTFRSSTRNSQNSVMSGTLLDSTIKSNRATELRLLKDMDEHHQHSHTPNQSMPIEIRGFKLEGTSLSVPDHATIRPLSNVNYQGSERVKSRRVYPWSSLHPLGTTSRNSSLVPIAELRRPSLDTTINEGQTLINEE